MPEACAIIAIEEEYGVAGRSSSHSGAARCTGRAGFKLGMLFLLPAFLVLAVFFLGPAVYAVYVGFTNMSLTGIGAATPSWVGLDNLHQILSDHQFFDSLRDLVDLSGGLGADRSGRAGHAAGSFDEEPAPGV